MRGAGLSTICVFGGSQPGRDPRYTAAARATGHLLATHGIGIVYGGGGTGMMGAVADGVLAAGGRVTGVIPELLMRLEKAHPGVTDMRVVTSMHERKRMMADLSDAFLTLPGGFGTFEEICEMVTWSQLGIHTKPCGLLNVDGYYDPLLQLFDQAVDEGFLLPAYRRLIVAAETPEVLLDRLSEPLLPSPMARLARENA